MNKKANSWRTPVYINQVPEMMRKNQTAKSPFRPCERYICINRKNGTYTTGIKFQNGKVFVGDDVWRLSNRADCCDYPFRQYKNQLLAEGDFEFRDAPSWAFTFSHGAVEERRCQICV